jgi:hypothetical protein
MNKKSYIKLEEINLPFDELVLGDDELFVIKRGFNYIPSLLTTKS